MNNQEAQLISNELLSQSRQLANGTSTRLSQSHWRLISSANSHISHPKVNKYLFQYLNLLLLKSESFLFEKKFLTLLDSMVPQVQTVNLKFVLIFIHNLVVRIDPQTFQSSLAGLLGLQLNDSEQLYWQMLLLSKLFSKTDSCLRRFSPKVENLLPRLHQLFQKFIVEKNLSTLVQGLYPSDKTLNFKQSSTYAFKLSTKDLDYLLQQFSSVSEQLIARGQSALLSRQLDLTVLLSQVSFLGAYNSSLQLYLQPIYSPAICTLLYIYSHSSLSKTDKMQVEGTQTVSQPLFDDQLVQGLLANLAHLNHKFVEFIQNKPELLFIALSCTKLKQRQETMREWSLLFIKHASQVSSRVREIVSSVKKQVKTVSSDIIT